MTPALMRALACATTCVLLGACAAAAGDRDPAAIELPDLERGTRNDDARDSHGPTMDTSIVPKAERQASGAACAVTGVCELKLDGTTQVPTTNTTSSNAASSNAELKAEVMAFQWNAIKKVIKYQEKHITNPGDIVQAAVQLEIRSGRLLQLLDANEFDDVQLCQVAHKCMEYQDSEFFPVLLQTKSEKHIALLRKVIESDNVFADLLRSTNQTFVNNVLQCLPEMDMSVAKIEEALRNSRCDVAVMSLNPANMAAGVVLITNYLNGLLQTEDQSKPKTISPMTADSNRIFQSALEHPNAYAPLLQYDAAKSYSDLANALENLRKISLLVALHQTPEVLAALVQGLESICGLSQYTLSFPAQLSTTIPLHVATLVLAGLVECSSSDGRVQKAFLNAAFEFKSTIAFVLYNSYSNPAVAPFFSDMAFLPLQTTTSTSEELTTIISKLSALNCQAFASILTAKFDFELLGAQMANSQLSTAVAPIETDKSALLPAQSPKPDGLQRAFATLAQILMTIIGLPGLFCTEWFLPCWADCIQSRACHQLCCGRKSILKPFFVIGAFFAVSITNYYNAVAGFFLGVFLIPLSLMVLASMCRPAREY